MTVPFLSVKPKAIKLKVSPRFPAQLLGGRAIDVTKANGNYTIDLDFSELPQVITPPTGAYAPVWSPTLNSYVMVPLSALGGGIPDAPSDGSYYARRNAAWSPVIPDAPSDGNLYGRLNAAWSVVPAGIADAPSDGNPYARRNGAWVASLRIDANNNVISGPGGAGGSITTSNLNILIGNQAGRSLTAQNAGQATGENIFIGHVAGSYATTAAQCTVLGSEAGAALTGDVGHTLFGYQAGLSLNSNTTTWNTLFGHTCGRFVTIGGSNVAMGRGALGTETDGSYAACFGHAAGFTAQHCQGLIAIGDGASAAPQAGDTNWQGSGLTYFPALNDTATSYVGRNTGKATVDARTNSHAYGTMARIPKKDNVMVLGHGLAAVETVGRFWDGFNRTDITANAAMTISIANIMAGLVLRGGTLTGAVNDTTDTAENIVANGPGYFCEVPSSMEFSFGNLTGGGFTTTLVGGAGVAVSGLGLGGAVATGVLAKFRVIISNSIPGSCAAALYRVG